MFWILLLWRLPAVQAQPIQLDLEEVPLEEALALVRVQSGVDVIFVQRLVQEHTVTCRYRGAQVEQALACLLADVGLRAEPVRRRQYVVVEGRAASEDLEAAPVRGPVTGSVVDAESGAVLPGAHVYLPALRLGTTTNAGGYFAFPALPQGVYRAQSTYLGYARMDTVLAVGTPAVLRLQPRALESPGILVEAGRTAGGERGLEVAGSVLTLQELERLPLPSGRSDLFQALHWLPGVQRAGSINGAMIVRGGEPDQNLYLLDGAPVYHPWHAFSLISTFQTETFQDIRFYRGAFPAEHGGRLSSVLDLQMKDGSRTRPSGTAALSVLSGRFMAEGPLSERASFMISGRRSYLDKLIGREHPVEGTDGRRDTLRTGYYFYDLSAKVTVQPKPGHHVSFSHYRGRDDLDLRLPFDLSLDFSSWLRPAELFFEVDQYWGNQLYSARHGFLASPRLFISTTAYHSRYRAVEGAFIQPTSSASMQADYRVRLFDLGLRVDVDYYRALSHQVRAGVQLVSHRFHSLLDAAVARSPGAVEGMLQESRLHAWEAVAYVQDTWKPSARWQILPGLRASVFSGGSYAALNPRLEVRYALWPERLFLHGAAGTQVQYLHRLRDRYSFMYDLVSSRWIPASPSVRPSSSVHLEAGAAALPAPWLTLRVDFYGRQGRDVLLPRDAYRTKDGLEGPGIEVGALLGQYTPAYARAYGVELSAEVERRGWQLWGSYRGGRALNRVPARSELQYRAAHFDVPRSFRGILNHRRGFWQFTLSTELRSGYPQTMPVARYQLGDPLDEPVVYLHRPHVNNGRLPPHFRADLAVGYRFRLLGAAWQAQLYVYNVTNRRNVVARSYDPAQEVVRPKDRRSLPILPLFELEVGL